MTQAYPLQWPVGWPRAQRRVRASFGKLRTVEILGEERQKLGQTSNNEAVLRLTGELRRLRAEHITLSTNLTLRGDGLPLSKQREPDDPGAAVYFRLGGKDIALACDKWDRVADNINALAKHIEAMRGMDRWGVGTAKQAFAGYEALPPPKAWWEVLGLSGPNATNSEITAAYRRASQAAHPDRPGGSHDKMAAVNAARDQARAPDRSPEGEKR